MPAGEAAPQQEWVGIRTGIPPAPPPLQAPGITTPSSHGGSGSQGTVLGSQLQIPPQGLSSPSPTSLDEDPRGPGLVLAGVPQVLLCFLRGPGAEQGERRCHGPSAAFTPFPPHSRQEILHFLHGDVPGGVQRGLQAAVGGVDGAG